MVDGCKALLLRPDIVREFLDKFCEDRLERLVTWVMIGVNICEVCYEKQNLVEV